MAKPGNKTFYKDGRRYGNDPEISNLDAIPFLFLHGTKYVPYRPRKGVQYVQRIMCLEVPKNTRYKAFKKS